MLVRPLTRELTRPLPRPLPVAVGFHLGAFMAAQSDGLWLDFGKTASLFQDVSATIPADGPGEVIGLALDQRAPGHDAQQATTGFKPTYQAGGVSRFDGLDDNLAPNYALQDGPNFVVARVTVVPNATTQVILGVNGPGDANRLRLGIVGAGQLRVSFAGVDLTGTADLRGQTVVVGLSAVSGELRLFVGDQQEATSTATGHFETAIKPFIGARNNNGVPANFFGGDIHALVVGRQTLDLDLFKQIASKL